MNLNDPKQKELLARYRQQLLAQYQKQMLAAAAAKAKAASGAATGATAAASNSAPQKPVAATPPAQPSQAAATPQQQQRRELVDHPAAQSTQEPKAAPSTATAAAAPPQAGPQPMPHIAQHSTTGNTQSSVADHAETGCASSAHASTESVVTCPPDVTQSRISGELAETQSPLITHVPQPGDSSAPMPQNTAPIAVKPEVTGLENAAEPTTDAPVDMQEPTAVVKTESEREAEQEEAMEDTIDNGENNPASAAAQSSDSAPMSTEQSTDAAPMSDDAPSNDPAVKQENPESDAGNAECAAGDSSSQCAQATSGKKRSLEEMRDDMSQAPSAVSNEEHVDMEVNVADEAQPSAPAAAATTEPSSTDADVVRSPARKRARVTMESNDCGDNGNGAPAPPTSEIELEPGSAMSEAWSNHENSPLAMQNEEVSAEVESLSVDVARLSAMLKSKTEDSERAAANHALEMERLAKEISVRQEDADATASALKSEIEQLTNNLSEMRTKNEELASRAVQDADAQVAALQQELKSAQDAFASLEQTSAQQLEESAAELTAKSREVAEKTERIGEQDARIVDLTAELNARAADTAPLTAENDGLKSAMAQLQEQLSALEGSLADKAESHAREMKQKEAMILSLGGSLAELRARMGNCACTKIVEMEDALRLGAQRDATEGDAEEREVREQTVALLKDVQAELERVKGELADSLAAKNDLASKLDKLRGEYKVEIAALSDSYETELESIKLSQTASSQSGSVNGDDASTGGAAAMRDETDSAASVEGEEQALDQASDQDAKDCEEKCQEDQQSPIAAKSAGSATTVVDMERKVKLQYEERLSQYERQAAEQSSRVSSLEADLQTKRDEVQRLHAQLAAFSLEAEKEQTDADAHEHDAAPPRKPDGHGDADAPAVAPMSLTVRRLRQWIGGAELRVDASNETLDEFAARAARALKMCAPTSLEIFGRPDATAMATEEDSDTQHAQCSMAQADADGTAPDQETSEDRAGATVSENFENAPGAKSSKSRFRLRRPGSEALLADWASLKSFDVVYVTSPAEEDLFAAVSSAHVVCG